GRRGSWAGGGEGGGRRARGSLGGSARIGEGEQRGVQADAANRIAGRPERAIADDRMSEGRELGADLAAPSGAQAQLEHGRARAALAYAVVGDRLAAAASGPDAQRRGILDDAIAERAGIVAH